MKRIISSAFLFAEVIRHLYHQPQLNRNKPVSCRILPVIVGLHPGYGHTRPPSQ